MLADKKTIKALRLGSETAFEEIYRAYYNPIFFLILSIVKNRAVAEDITQDAFVKMVNNVASLKKLSAFDSYFYQIAKNLSFNYLNENKVINLEEADDFGTSESNVSLINEINKFLTKDENLLISYRFIYGFNFAEIAKIMDKPSTTVHRIYETALKKVREAM